LSSESLAKGLALNLTPLEYRIIRMRHRNASQQKAEADSIRDAQARIAHAYQRLQIAAGAHGLTAELKSIKEKFLAARSAYERRAYTDAVALAQDAIMALQSHD
jgi:hypothetical protein